RTLPSDRARARGPGQARERDRRALRLPGSRGRAAMIAWVLWFFAVLHLFLLEGWFAGWTSLAPDLSLAVALFCPLYARPDALPGLLLCAALSRSILAEGTAAQQLLILGVPVAVLLPLRVVFSKGSVLWPCLASGFLAFTAPRITGLLYRVTGEGVPVP